MDIQTLIQVKFSGQLSETSIYINLAIQAISVMIGGIILWRVSTAIHVKKQNERAANKGESSPFRRKWR